MPYIAVPFVAGTHWTWAIILKNICTVLPIVFELTNEPIEMFVILTAIGKINLNKVKLPVISELIFKYEIPSLIIFSIRK